SKASKTEEKSSKLTHIKIASPTFPESFDQIHHYVPIYLGYFEEEGLEVELVDGTGKDTKLLQSGDVQFIGPSSGLVLSGREAGLDLQTVFNECPVNIFGFAVKSDSDIKDWKDFEGKSIALGDASWQPLAEPILQAGGIDTTKIEWVVLGDTRYQGVDKGQADILFTWLGEIGQLLGQGFDFRYFNGDELLPQVSNTIVTTETYAAENPEIVKAYNRALAKGIYFIFNNPEAAADIVLQSVPSLEIDKAGAVSTSDYCVKTYLGVTEEEQKAAIEAGIGTSYDETWTNAIDAALKAGTITKDVDAKDVFTNDYIDNSWDKAAVEEDAKNYEFKSKQFTE
ncbi:MAG: ABC transporter substrate-binding protein, partial [Clostridiales Family XIII bacterium]|nr:ABC transporter substrate-binding protein [Clostridiales Family XIII bacterium]